MFGPSEDNVVVVDAVLVVDMPLPPVFVRWTAAPDDHYDADATGLTDARVSVRTGEAVYEYREDSSTRGRYLPPEGAFLVEPQQRYELRVALNARPLVRASTLTPSRVQIREILLLDDATMETRKQMSLFSDIGEEVYRVEENQLEYTGGLVEARLANGATAVSYQIAVFNLEDTSPMLFDIDWIREEDVARQGSSPPLGLDDGIMRLPWFTVIFAGRHKVKLFAIDQNWFDLIRSDNVEREGGSGQAGDWFQRPLFNIENGIGLFASASVDSFGFFVRPEGTPACDGCKCWGCDNNRVSRE